MKGFKRVETPPPVAPTETIVLELSVDEAKRFSSSLISDVTWSQTSDDTLYSSVYHELTNAIHRD